MKALKVPTNANPARTDVFAGDTTATQQIEIQIPKETSSLELWVVNASGNDMNFHREDDGADGAVAGANAVSYTQGRSYKWSRDGGDPTRGRIDPVKWSIFISGDFANPTIHVESSLHRGV